LAGCRPPIVAACLLPDESQVRNPRHLKALQAACVRRDVALVEGMAVEGFAVRGARVEGAWTSAGTLSAASYCVAAGPWSRELLERLGAAPALRPVRGQIVLLKCDRPPLTRIVNEGPRYLVPRDDGRVLVGSTEEDAGFEKRTTAAGVQGLLDFALGLAPALESAQVERTWAGLRPAAADGVPYLGPVPGFDNLFLAAGHFRSGLALSPATAVVMAELIRGQSPQIDLDRFALRRPNGVTQAAIH
jgi:glycine oxidase